MKKSKTVLFALLWIAAIALMPAVTLYCIPMGLPYLGYGVGRVGIICIAILWTGIIFSICVKLLDWAHDSRRHRKKILRKRERRNRRYQKESLMNKRAAI